MAFWVMFFISLAFTVAGELLRPKQKFDDAKPSALGDFSFPTADASRVVPVFWGTCKLQGPNCVWFGDYSMEPINKKVKTGWFSSDVVTQGFRNYLGVQLTWAWGKIDEFVDFLADDTHVKHTVTETEHYYVITMDDPTHMSADEPTNGLAGTMYLYKGTPSQPADTYLNTAWAEDETSAFRRMCYSVLRHCYIGNSETPPPFALVARRTPNQLGLTGGKHNINGDSNVACMCYEILTDKLWGLKMDPSRIDVASFIACGNTLAAEGLGVSMMVDNPLIAKDLIADALRHVDGVIYPDPVTGLYTMKLARNDYDVDTLQVFDDSNISDENFEFSRLSWDDTRNTIIVNYVDRSRNFQTIPVQYQDLANISARRGQIDPETIDFLGFSNYAAAYQAAARACKTRSSPLVRVQMTVNRGGYDLRPGSVFKLFKPNFRIDGLVMRVIEINYGTLDDPRIQVVATEDIFAVNGNAYAPPPDGGWVPPGGSSIAPLVRSAFEEVPYEMLAAEQRVVMALGTRDDSTSVTGFEIWSDPAGGTAYSLTGSSRGVVASGVLQAEYGLTAADDPVGFVVADVEDASLLASVTTDERASGVSLCKIGNEYLAWKTVAAAGNQVTITEVLRGVFDTVPEVHPVGSVVWFFNETIPLTSSLPYTADLTLKGKLMSVDRNRRQDIATDVSVPLSLTTASRAFRPNPPGKIRMNGAVPAATVSGAFTVSWEHRNRLSLKAVSQDATGVTSEPGVTYLVEVRNASTNALIASKSGLVGPSATVNVATASVKVLIYSVLNGVACLRPQTFVVAVTNASGNNTVTGVTTSGGGGGTTVIYDGGVPSDPTPPPPTDDPPSGGPGGTPSGGLPTLVIGATVISVATYGAVGNGTTDDTADIQAAINALPAGGGTITGVAGKTYLINPEYQDSSPDDSTRCGLKLKSNVRLDFSMCKIKGKVTNNDSRYLILAYEVNNFEIMVSEITGYRDDPAWTGPTVVNGVITNTKEKGHNIAVFGCNNFIIKNTTTRKATGDGISIGRLNSDSVSSFGYVDNVISTQNRRQGLSIGRSDNIHVTNSTFSQTQGTAPQAGIDVEPDNPSTSNSTNTTIDNCILEDNTGPGIQLYKSADQVSITNCFIRRNKAGVGGVYAIDSSIGTMTGNDIRDNSGWGLQLAGVTDNYNVSGNTFMNNRTASLGNHPDGSTVTTSGTSNAEVGQHIKIGTSTSAVTIGSNTYGPL